MAFNATRTQDVLVPQLEELINYNFNDRKYGWELLNCKGAMFYQHSEGNKRLALLGDTVLKLQILAPWYQDTQLSTRIYPTQILSTPNEPQKLKPINYLNNRSCK